MNNYLASREEDFSTKEGWLKARADYFANITLVDNMVGRIIDSLKENGLYDDTIIIFTSEHGEMMGDHGMLEKRTLYEESAKVPLLVKLNGKRSSQKLIKGSFSHIDLVPTILTLLDQKIPKNLQGQNKTDSFKTLSLENNEVIVEWNGQGQIDDRNLGSEDINNLNQNPRRSLIFNRMKLNLTLNDKSEFFDLNIDPYEEVNRIDDPKYSEIISEMQKKISLWQKNNNDLFRF